MHVEGGKSIYDQLKFGNMTTSPIKDGVEDGGSLYERKKFIMKEDAFTVVTVTFLEIVTKVIEERGC